MTKTEAQKLRRTAQQYREQATEHSRWIHLNHANAETWRAEAARLRDLACAIEVNLAIADHNPTASKSAA